MSKQIGFNSAFLVVQPMVHAMPHRPLEVNYNDHIANELYNNTNGCTNISAASLSKVSTKIIAPSTESKGIRLINGGWNERHIAGIILIDVVTPSARRTEALSVYTDIVDLSSDDINPDTQFIIDSRRVISSSNNNTMLPSGAVVVDNHLNLQPVNVQTFDGHLQQKELLTRPSDTLFAIQNLKLGVEMDDFRSFATTSGSSAQMRDGISSHFLSRVTNSLKTAKIASEQEMDGWGDDIVVYDSAGCMINDSDNSSSAVMNLLHDRTQFGESGVFTWGELCRLLNMDRRAKENLNIIVPGRNDINDTREFSDHGHSADKTTNVAYRLHDRVSKEMMFRLLGRAVFVIGQDAGGYPVVECVHANKLLPNISDELVVQSIEEMKSVIEIELVSMITQYADVYSIKMDIHAQGVNNFEVMLDGNHSRHSFAAYCNALTSGMVADSKSDVLNLAAGIDCMLQDTVKVGGDPDNVRPPVGSTFANVGRHNNGMPAIVGRNNEPLRETRVVRPTHATQPATPIQSNVQADADKPRTGSSISFRM